MKVLVACEFSGRVRDAFLKRGHDAWSCDLNMDFSENGNGDRHIQANVRPLLRNKWDLVIAHPPCTYLANSGVSRFKTDKNRMRKMEFGAEFFNLCLQANAPRVCVENPVHHRYAKELIRKQDQVIQPWQFGEPVKKATCLWLKGLPLLVPTKIVKPFQDIMRESPGPWRKMMRSVTFLGIAEAMAEQWGSP